MLLEAKMEAGCEAAAPFASSMQEEGCGGAGLAGVGGERGGDGVSSVITLGLAGQPELETDDAPGVVEIVDCALLDEMLVFSAERSRSVTGVYERIKSFNLFKKLQTTPRDPMFSCRCAKLFTIQISCNCTNSIVLDK